MDIVEPKLILDKLRERSLNNQNHDNTNTNTDPVYTGMGQKRIEKILAEETSELMKQYDLNEQQLEEIQESFKLFDLHGRGIIKGPELQKAALSVGKELTDEDIKEIILEIDENGNDEIDFLSFVALLGKNAKEPLLEADVQNVFNVFDHNGDSFISPEEMHKTFLALGVDLSGEEVNQIFEKHDHDLKGLLSYQDLKPIVDEVYQEIAPHNLYEGEQEEVEEQITGGGGFN